jgi:ketosteroid isomerase-like protein
MLTRTLCLALATVITGTQLEAAPINASEKRAVLVLRAENNRAIAAKDLDGVMSISAEDYVLVGGNSGIERSKAEARKGWAEEFTTPGFKRYVRTPTQVEIGNRKGVLRAAELGRWEGFRSTAAGESRAYGRYFAHWSKASGRWRLVSDTYVTLGCRGSGC